MERSTVVLPLPDGPMMRQELARTAVECHVERDRAGLLQRDR